MPRGSKYTDEFRAKVVAAVAHYRAMFKPNAAVMRASAEFGVSRVTIWRWVDHANATNAAGQPSPFDAVLREMSDRLTLLVGRVDGLQEQVLELARIVAAKTSRQRRILPIDDGEDRHVGEPI